MTSMSVKNRVAMFEKPAENDGNTDEQSVPSVPARNLKTPSGNTPKGNNRSSWPWPTEDGIPAPQKNKDGNKRYSSPFLPSGSGPVILPQRSSSKSKPVTDSPFKVIENQDSAQKSSSFQKHAPSPRRNVGTKNWSVPKTNPNTNRVSPKPSLSVKEYSAAFGAGKVPDTKPNVESDENTVSTEENAPGAETAEMTKPNETISPEEMLEASLQEAQDAAQEENSTAGFSTASSVSNSELSNIANRALSMAAKHKQKAPQTTAPSPSPSTKVSRAGKLTQARRDGTPDSMSAAASRAPSPLRRGGRTMTNVSHQEARKALLQAAQRKREKVEAKLVTTAASEETDKKVDASSDNSARSAAAADRLALKAANVLALKNSAKLPISKPVQLPATPNANTAPEKSKTTETKRELEIYTAGSVVSVPSTDSASKRRMNHPALVSRASPRLSVQMERSFPSLEKNLERPPTKPGPSAAKPFSEELFSSLRHFSAARNDGGVSSGLSSDNSGSYAEENEGKRVNFVENDVNAPTKSGRPPQPHSAASPIAGKSPKTLREAMAEGSPSVARSFDYSQSPRNSTSDDSTSNRGQEQEDSMHSTSSRNGSRNYMDGFYAVGQPKYASARQSFQTREGGYVSSLSSTTLSNHTMISSAGENNMFQMRVGTNLPRTLDALGSTVSPGHTMRSNQSLAHSIISVSPRGDPRLVNNQGNMETNSEFEYLRRTPSKQSGIDADPSFNKRHNSSVIEDRNPLETVHAPHLSEKREGIDTVDDKPNQPLPEIKETILSSNSSTSGPDNPAGFVFHDEDTEGDDGMGNRDQAGAPSDALSGHEELFGVNAIGTEEETEASFRTELRQGDLKAEGLLEFRKGGSNDPGLVELSDPSTSTKRTTSTSIRTGLSNIQVQHENVGSVHRRPTGVLSPREGSTSIRTGLSGIQNPQTPVAAGLEAPSMSESMRSTRETMAAEGEAEVKNSALPDTIDEDGESASGIKSKKSAVDGSTLLAQSTATTTTSSGESRPAVSSSESGSETDQGNRTNNQSDNSESEHSERSRKLLPKFLKPLRTQRDNTEDETSAVASPASKGSRWKMKMPNVIKSVLSKPSPRNGQPLVPKKSDTSSREDDDDIFGGLDDDLSNVSNVLGPSTPKRPKTPKTPMAPIERTKKGRKSKQAKQVQGKFFTSGHTRRSEPPKRKEPQDTTQRSSRTEPKVDNKTKPQRMKQQVKNAIGSPTAATNPNSLYSNDRSGTIVSEVQFVDSDITSSILAGQNPVPKLERPPSAAPRSKNKAEDMSSGGSSAGAHAKTPKAKTSSKNGNNSSRSRASRKSKSSNSEAKSEERKTPRKSIEVDNEEDATLENTLESDETTKPAEDPPSDKNESMFMNFGCGIADALTNICQVGGKPVDGETTLAPDDLEMLSMSGSGNSSSHLTDLEKRVWNEWDKLDTNFKKQSSASKRASKTKTTLESVDENKELHDKKREAARGKIVAVASSAVSSQTSKGGEEPVVESGYVTESTGGSSGGSVTIESVDTGDNTGSAGSATSGEGETTTASSHSHTASTNSSDVEYSCDETGTYYSGSAMMSEMMSVNTRNAPILLSTSQRSLIDRFAKQMAHVGVEVLKLNRRNVWQARYFTVSKEQVALISHNGKSKSSADVAQCPKALLWLKKFNGKGGGYSVSNIDKNGHGGMLLVNLLDVRVESKPAERAFPRKLAEKYKNSVILTLFFLFNGEDRSIEFRCKDNDEAHFICTCLRVMRDLLKREQSLRLKAAVARK